MGTTLKERRWTEELLLIIGWSLGGSVIACAIRRLSLGSTALFSYVLYIALPSLLMKFALGLDFCKLKTRQS